MNSTIGVILFDGFRVEKFHFDWDVSLERKNNGNYRQNVAYNGITQTDESKQIDLVIRVFDNEFETFEASPVKLELILAGKFHKADGSSWDDRWNSNTLAILFPYARSIIASFTAQSGLETINLPTINTNTLIKAGESLAEKAKTHH